MVNNKISEDSKLAKKKYKTKHVWVGKMTHWGFCLSQSFNPITKWDIHKPELVKENEMHKFIWDFQVQIDYQKFTASDN